MSRLNLDNVDEEYYHVDDEGDPAGSNADHADIILQEKSVINKVGRGLLDESDRNDILHVEADAIETGFNLLRSSPSARARDQRIQGGPSRDEDRVKDRQQGKKSFMADAITSEAAKAQGVSGKPVRFDRVTKIDYVIYKKWLDDPSFMMRIRGTKKDARLKASLSRVRKMCEANFAKNIFKGIYGGPAIKSPAKAGTSAEPARDEAAGSARDEAAGSARDEAASSVERVEFPEMDFHDRDEAAGSDQDVEFRGRDVGEEAVSDATARQAVIDWLVNNLNISLEPVIRSTIENLLSSLLTHGVESSNEPTIHVADFLRGLRKECAAKIFYILLVLINEGYLDVEEDDIQQEPLFERAVFKRGRKM